MSFVHQTYREWRGEYGNSVVSAPIETVSRDDGSILDMPNHGFFRYGVLKDIVASFLVTSAEEDQIRQCVEHLIGENGIEWAWKSIDIIKDIMEFHGFVRKVPALE